MSINNIFPLDLTRIKSSIWLSSLQIRHSSHHGELGACFCLHKATNNFSTAWGIVTIRSSKICPKRINMIKPAAQSILHGPVKRQIYYRHRGHQGPKSHCCIHIGMMLLNEAQALLMWNSCYQHDRVVARKVPWRTDWWATNPAIIPIIKINKGREDTSNPKATL